MKLIPNSIVTTISASVISLLSFAGSINLAIADNTAFLKESFKNGNKVEEAKTTNIKEIDLLERASLDASFRKLDANKDGNISLKEAVKDKALTSQFDAVDVNHDGMLSIIEYTSYKASSYVKSTKTVPEATN